MGLLPLIGAFAQQDTTVNRTVIVENEYNPTVMDASKINVMPQMNETKATKKNINYATSLRQVSAIGLYLSYTAFQLSPNSSSACPKKQ